MRTPPWRRMPVSSPPPADLDDVTAQQVEEGSATLEDLALAVRARYEALDQIAQTQGVETLQGIGLVGCLVRQEAYLSGSTYLVALTLDGRVFAHAKDMSLSSRRLNGYIYGEILSVLGATSIDLDGLTSPDPSYRHPSCSLKLQHVAGANGWSVRCDQRQSGRLRICRLSWVGLFGDPAVAARRIRSR